MLMILELGLDVERLCAFILPREPCPFAIRELLRVVLAVLAFAMTSSNMLVLLFTLIFFRHVVTTAAFLKNVQLARSRSKAALKLLLESFSRLFFLKRKQRGNKSIMYNTRAAGRLGSQARTDKPEERISKKRLSGGAATKMGLGRFVGQ